MLDDDGGWRRTGTRTMRVLHSGGIRQPPLLLHFVFDETLSRYRRCLVLLRKGTGRRLSRRAMLGGALRRHCGEERGVGSREALLDRTRAAILPSILRGLRESSDFFFSFESAASAPSSCRLPRADDPAASGGFAAPGDPFLAARAAMAACSVSSTRSSSVDADISSSDSRRGFCGEADARARAPCCGLGSGGACSDLSLHDMAFFRSSDNTGPCSPRCPSSPVPTRSVAPKHALVSPLLLLPPPYRTPHCTSLTPTPTRTPTPSKAQERCTHAHATQTPRARLP
jgi:hypothetical protein